MTLPMRLPRMAMPPDLSVTKSLKGPTRRDLKKVYLSLGSNLGDRAAHTQKALAELDAAGIKIQRVSSLYRTEPLDFLPQAWFLNCVVEATTTLMPLQLLRTVKAVEWAVGRRRGVSKGPRPIDIDILLYENVVVHSPELTIPHARLKERRFVLIPLRELSPTVRHPVNRRTVTELLHESLDRSQVVLYRPQAEERNTKTGIRS